MNKIIFIFLICIFAFWLLISNLGQAQEPILDFTLTWSTNSYIPPYYLGKALPTDGSLITVIASPDTKTTINPDDLDYHWFINNHRQSAASGLGQASFTFLADAPINTIYEIKARVIGQQRVLIDEKTIFIKLVAPEIILYPLAASRIIHLNQSRLDFFTSDINNEINVMALPYFFDVSDMAGLNFTWQFGEQALINPEQKNQNLFTLKIGELLTGLNKELNVLVQNLKNPDQKALNKVNILVGI